MATANYFELLDYILLFLVLALSFCIGMYYTFIKHKTTEYLLAGGRDNSIFPAAASVMASTVSAISIIGYPAEVYSYGIQIFQIAILTVFFVPICAHVFVPFFHPMKLVSIYEYLEYRFDSVAVRWFASFTFILQQTMLAGLVLYAPSIVLQAFLGFPPWISIVGIGLCGTIYTSFGGLKAVLATDTFQVFIMFAGMGAILVKCLMMAGSISNAFEIAYRDGRLKLFDFTIDPFMRHNFFNFLIGFAFVDLVQPGTRQHEFQRYSCMPTISAAKKSLNFSILIKAACQAISLLSGIAIYAVFAGCDPVKAGKIKKADGLVPMFVTEELIAIPGMLGLFTSCIFCGVLSSYSSQLNALVAVTWTDFLSKLPICQKFNETEKARASMGLGVLYGVLIVTLAFLGDNFGNIYVGSYIAAGPPTGVMCAVFIMALFMPFITKQGAFGGMVIGLTTTIYIGILGLMYNSKTPGLPTSIANCTIPIMGNLTYESSNPIPAAVEWPHKMYTLSYTLYPPFAAAVTVISGILITLIVKPFSKYHEVDPKYLHPYVRKMEKPVNTRQDSIALNEFKP